jgi:hypothetical protein
LTLIWEFKSKCDPPQEPCLKGSAPQSTLNKGINEGGPVGRPGSVSEVAW